MKNHIKKMFFFVPAFLLFARKVFAQGGTPPPTHISFPNPLAAGTDSLYDFIALIINNVVIPVGGVVSVLFIIYSGFMFVTARGNTTKLAAAKQSLLYAAIGAAVLLGSWAIALAIQGTINQLVQ